MVAPETLLIVRLSSETAHLSRLGVTGAHPFQAGEITVELRRTLDSFQIRGCIEPRKNGVHDLRPWHAAFAVAYRNITRPVAHIIEPELLLRPEINHRVPMFRPPHFPRPENFHEISRFGFFEIVEVATQPELLEEPRRAGAVSVPAAPNPFAVALPANHQRVERVVIELEIAPGAQ